MPNNLSILRDLGRARRDRQVDQGPVTDFEPIEVGDFVLGNYLNEAVPPFLQPRLSSVLAAQVTPRALQSLLLTTRIHASASASVKNQIERLATDQTIPTTELARAASALWHAQLEPDLQAELRRRFISDIVQIGSRLNLNPMPGRSASSSLVAPHGQSLSRILDRLLLRIRG